MRNMIIAWVVSLALIGGGGAYLMSAEVPEGKPSPEPVVKVVVEDAPELSSGNIDLDLTPPAEQPEDCAGTC